MQIIANLLLRKDVALTFASVAGAEYLPEEGLFVYDELMDPYQSFYDLGWTMEFVGSDMEMSSTFPWGSFMGSCPSTAFFFYDAESGVLYNPYGEQCGYTHNIDGLRSEAYGSSIYRSCTFSSSYDMQNQYFVEAFFMLEEGETVTADTPIYAVQCGSLSSSSAGEYILPEGELTPNQLATITSEFFDDFYHNSDVGGKTTNYALASFFGKPDEINTAFLPLQSDAELEQWCEKYLNLSASDLKVMQAPGTAECGTPYVTLLSGNQQNDLLTLHYYNEMQKQYAVLVLRKTNDGYQFVSNLPEA